MIIAFAGCDGAGKSTQIKRSHNWLLSLGYEVEIIDKWDILDHQKFNECMFINTSLEDLRLCISRMKGISRAMFLFWSISLTLTRDNIHSNNKIFLLDGYWMKHAASEIIYGCSEDWVLKTVELLPIPDIVVYLDVPPEIALSRKSSLTPYECGRKEIFEKKDFLNHQASLRSLLLSWSRKRNWKNIDSSLSNEDVFHQIQSAIQGVLEEKRK
ncbi:MULTISPECIES: dTMP kinase [Bacillus]|uniref:Uncharacterized protein n=1 Tax=Bacillus rugosus TaxID=2715209 RepID=A0ACD3ZYQ8_9BACI|nr:MULTISPECIES: hypothetical protein [Bacillus]MBY4602887.1 hypothetical protein [Bacillus sp. SPARC3]UPV78975.1 hypothetical protein M0696_19615 [Bacillus rugosus]